MILRALGPRLVLTNSLELVRARTIVFRWKHSSITMAWSCQKTHDTTSSNWARLAVDGDCLELVDPLFEAATRQLAHYSQPTSARLVGWVAPAHYVPTAKSPS